MTGWLIFWGIFIAYWAVGIKRMPLYFKRSEASFKKDYPMTCRDDPDAAHKHAAWAALGLAAFWPFHEGGRWIRDHIIHTMTAEERRVNVKPVKSSTGK